MCSLAEEDLEEVTGTGASCGGSGCQANGCHACGREASTDTRRACEGNGCAPTQNGNGAAEPAHAAAQALCHKCKQRRADVSRVARQSLAPDETERLVPSPFLCVT